MQLSIYYLQQLSFQVVTEILLNAEYRPANARMEHSF